jgi:hypothetical protein
VGCDSSGRTLAQQVQTPVPAKKKKKRYSGIKYDCEISTSGQDGVTGTRHTLSSATRKNIKSRIRDVAQVVEHLPSKHKALNQYHWKKYI